MPRQRGHHGMVGGGGWGASGLCDWMIAKGYDK
jgi:hypothetical protein